MATNAHGDDGAAFFSRQFDRRVWITLAVILPCGALGTALTLYVSWQDRIRVGYAPPQPIAYSHVLHAGAMQIDCQYCHTRVESGFHATVPTLDICMNCHAVFKGDAQKPEQVARIRALLDYWDARRPVVWRNVYDLADFAYFHHGRHIQAGLDCRNCHGAVEAMPVVKQVAPLTMGWCLRCHMGRAQPVYAEKSFYSKAGAKLVHDPIYREILAPIHCSTCHR